MFTTASLLLFSAVTNKSQEMGQLNFLDFKLLRSGAASSDSDKTAERYFFFLNFMIGEYFYSRIAKEKSCFWVSCSGLALFNYVCLVPQIKNN